jgi:hypothetical protein
VTERDPPLDPDREKRIHVVGLRTKGTDYVIVLSDRSEVSWNQWMSMSQNERWNQ